MVTIPHLSQKWSTTIRVKRQTRRSLLSLESFLNRPEGKEAHDAIVGMGNARWLPGRKVREAFLVLQHRAPVGDFQQFSYDIIVLRRRAWAALRLTKQNVLPPKQRVLSRLFTDGSFQRTIPFYHQKRICCILFRLICTGGKTFWRCWRRPLCTDSRLPLDLLGNNVRANYYSLACKGYNNVT